MKPETLKSEIVRLLRSKGRTFGEWTDEQILSWVGWFMHRNHCGIIADKDRLVGIGMIRYVNSATEAESPLAHFPNGKVVWVDLVIATCPLVFSILVYQLAMAMRHDGCDAKTLMGRRVGRSNRLFMVELGRLLRLKGSR